MSYKDEIRKWREMIWEVEHRITKLADQAMEEKGIRILMKDTFTGQDIPDPKMHDSAQWFNISVEWDCPDSPFGWCMYHIVHDRARDHCVFCGSPKERK